MNNITADTDNDRLYCYVCTTYRHVHPHCSIRQRRVTTTCTHRRRLFCFLPSAKDELPPSPPLEAGPLNTGTGLGLARLSLLYIASLSLAIIKNRSLSVYDERSARLTNDVSVDECKG